MYTIIIGGILSGIILSQLPTFYQYCLLHFENITSKYRRQSQPMVITSPTVISSHETRSQNEYTDTILFLIMPIIYYIYLKLVVILKSIFAYIYRHRLTLAILFNATSILVFYILIYIRIYKQRQRISSYENYSNNYNRPEILTTKQTENQKYKYIQNG